MNGGHISTVNTSKDFRRLAFDPDGICHCNPQPVSSPWGECPQCRRLDARTARR